MNPLKELTGRRPTNYSQWHRPPTLPPSCLLADTDWFEMRQVNGVVRPVACIETMQIGALFIRNAQQEYPLWDTKRHLLIAIAVYMNIPVYIVRHTSDCKLFSVARLTIKGQESLHQIMDEDEYKYFLINLGGNTQ